MSQRAELPPATTAEDACLRRHRVDREAPVIRAELQRRSRPWLDQQLPPRIDIPETQQTGPVIGHQPVAAVIETEDDSGVFVPVERAERPARIRIEEHDL